MPVTTRTYTGQRLDPLINPDDAMASQVNVQIKASTTIARGTVVGEITAQPGVYAAYASGNVDGTQNPVGILAYDVVTDSSKNITNIDEWGVLDLVTPIYTQGVFDTHELTGLDANAVTKLGGHLLEGTVTAGVFSF